MAKKPKQVAPTPPSPPERSGFAARLPLYRKIEAERGTRILAYVTGDRRGMETQIASDVIDLFVQLLDAEGPTDKISLVLHTNGGDGATAWRLVNLIQTFCETLEVIVPAKALSAGTMISLGANVIVMTKQAALGPIDPSLSHPLNPSIPGGNPSAKMPVSVEAVRGYLDEASRLGIKDAQNLATLYIDLSNKIHPIVLGEIFRRRAQIRDLAKKLLASQSIAAEKRQQIIDFLCGDSGSHDYTINRREAKNMGLNIETPSQGLYETIRSIHRSFSEEMQLLEPYSPEVTLGQATQSSYQFHRGVVEGTAGGSYAFVSEGQLDRATMPGPSGLPQPFITDQRTFEGWRKVK